MLLKWMMSPRGLRFDRWLVKHTGHSLLNRLFARQAGFPAQPALLLTTIGRRSGAPREVALPCRAHGNGWLLVGSKGGAPDDPYWVHNLRAHPKAEVIVQRRRRQVRARLLDGSDYDQLWARLCAEIPTYAGYQALAAPHRQIPLIVLEPIESTQ